MTYRCPDENTTRRPVKERLGRPARITSIQETHLELEWLKSSEMARDGNSKVQKKARIWRKKNKQY